MARGKNISVYLIDGIANGKIKAQISNWNGVAYKIPRSLLSECKDFEAFKQSGVYFLFGYRTVYVGQAEVRKTGKGIHQRIQDHEADKLKDSWDEVVVFTTKDNSFGRTDISYLENRFFNKAFEVKRYQMLNSVEPSIGTVTEEKEAELEEYIDYAELILGALGYKVFEPAGFGVSEVSKQPTGEKKKAQHVPELPSDSMKIGEYIRTAFKNLEASGYVFSDTQLEDLLSPQKSREIFGLNARSDEVAVLKVYDPKEEFPNRINGYTRYYSPTAKKRGTGYLLSFGGKQYLLTKEWYDNNKAKFIAWYHSLQ